MTSPSPAGRLGWADAAKGLCILLVVLHHTTVKHYPSLVPDDLGWIGDAWVWTTAALKPIRMPLFFVLAGFFAASSLTRGWHTVRRGRVANPYYVYVVWLLVLAVVFAVERDLVTNRTQNLDELVLDLLFASTGLWFLYALPVYFLLARATRRLDVRWVLGAAGLLALSTSALPMTGANRESVVFHAVYFLLGARLPDWVRAVARGAETVPGRGWSTPRLTVLFMAGTALVSLLDVPLSVSSFLLASIGVPLAIRASAAFESRAGDGRTFAALSALGRRTLPVYVLHMAVLAGLHHLPGLRTAAERIADVPYAAPVIVGVYPILAALAVTLASLALHALMIRGGLRSLFALPSGVRLPSTARLPDHPPSHRVVMLPVAR